MSDLDWLVVALTLAFCALADTIIRGLIHNRHTYRAIPFWCWVRGHGVWQWRWNRTAEGVRVKGRCPRCLP